LAIGYCMIISLIEEDRYLTIAKAFAMKVTIKSRVKEKIYDYTTLLDIRDTAMPCPWAIFRQAGVLHRYYKTLYVVH